MQTNTRKWWIAAIVVVAIAAVGIGYWGFVASRGGTGGEQALNQAPITEATGPEQVMTAPEVSPGPEETAVVPSEQAVTEEAAPVLAPAYSMDMAKEATSTRVLPVPFTVADVATLVQLLGPQQIYPLSEEELSIVPVIEEVTPAISPFDDLYIPPVIGAVTPSTTEAAPSATEAMPEATVVPDEELFPPTGVVSPAEVNPDALPPDYRADEEDL